MRTFKIFIKYLTYLFYNYKLRKTSPLCIMIDDNTNIDCLAWLFEENENESLTNPNQELELNGERLDASVYNGQSKTNDIHASTSNSDLAMVAERAQQDTGGIDSDIQKRILESICFGWESADEDDSIPFCKIPLFIHQPTKEQSSSEIAGNGFSMTERDTKSTNGGIGIQSNPVKRQCSHKDPCSSKRFKECEESESKPAWNSLSSSGTFVKEPEQFGTLNSIEVELVKEISTFSKIEETIEMIHKFRYPFVVLNSIKPRILQKKAEICKSNLTLEPLNKRLNELKNNLIAFEPYLKQLWDDRASLIKNHKLKKNNISCIQTLHDRFLIKKGNPNTFEFLKKFQAQYKITQIAIKDTLVDLSKHEYHNIVTNESLDIFESIFKQYIVPTFERKFISRGEKIPRKCFFRIKFISEKQIYFYHTLNHADYCTGFLTLLFDNRSYEFIKALHKHKKHLETLHNIENAFIFLNFEEYLSVEMQMAGFRLLDWYKREGKCWEFILTDKKYEIFMNELKEKQNLLEKIKF